MYQFEPEVLLKQAVQVKLCEKVDQFVKKFSPNTDNFLAFFIAFEQVRIWENVMDKQEVIRNAELCPSYNSANAFVLAVVFRQKI